MKNKKLYVVELIPSYESFEMCVVEATSTEAAIEKAFKRHDDYIEQEGGVAAFEVDLDSDGISCLMRFTI